jgi:hypothetical protein
MILGQRLKNAVMQLGNKAMSTVNSVGNKINPIINTVGNAINTVQKAKQIYRNLEKLIPRRRLE